MIPLDPSTRGRRNRAKGADCERLVARYMRPWYPDACRGVRNTHPDPGDIDCTTPSLWWSVKNCQAERYLTWFAEVDAKAGNRIGLLVVRRRGYASPGDWWCWMHLSDVATLSGQVPRVGPALGLAWVRMELAVALALLATNGLAPEIT